VEEPQFLVGELTDPEEIARGRELMDQFNRHTDWVQAHWANIVPQARGRYLAVAGQEAFLADTPEEALAAARAAHPEDQGIYSQYIRTERGPKARTFA
jgi:hypothetical protein